MIVAIPTPRLAAIFLCGSPFRSWLKISSLFGISLSSLGVSSIFKNVRISRGSLISVRVLVRLLRCVFVIVCVAVWRCVLLR